jgi:hypothetical protein
LRIPTWQMFLFLGIASFAPVVVSLRPGWWMLYYYGALLVWWVLVSVAARRWVAREEQKAERQLPRTLRPLRDAKNAEAAETPVRHALAEVRLIIVARDGVDLYDRIRRDQLGDETVRVIRDRRSTNRRLQLEMYIPDRRRGERRRYDIAPLLLTQRWAQVTLPRVDRAVLGRPAAAGPGSAWSSWASSGKGSGSH